MFPVLCYGLWDIVFGLQVVPIKENKIIITGGSDGKESACNVGDLGSILGLGRSPGEEKGYPLQYSGLENSMDCIVHGVAKSQTRLRDFHFTLLHSDRCEAKPLYICNLHFLNNYKVKDLFMCLLATCMSRRETENMNQIFLFLFRNPTKNAVRGFSFLSFFLRYKAEG